MNRLIFSILLLCSTMALGQGALSPVAMQQFFDNNGKAASGMCLYTYTSGTTSDAKVYTDYALSVAHTNPIKLNTAGRPPSPLYLDPTILYKFIFGNSVSGACPATPSALWSVDPVYNEGAKLRTDLASTVTNGASLIGFKQTGTGASASTVDAELKRSYRVSQFDTFAHALAAAVLAGKSLIVDANTTISTNTVITSHLIFLPGSVISHGSYTVSIATFDAGLQQIFSGSGLVTITKPLASGVKPHWFGAVMDGVTDDSTAMNKAVNTAYASNIYSIEIPANATVNVDSPIELKSRLRFYGDGSGIGDVYAGYQTSKFYSATSDIFDNTNGSLVGVSFENLGFESAAGGGHIFNLTATSTDTAVWRFNRTSFVQSNADKSIIVSGSFYELFMDNWSMYYPLGTTTPMFNIVGATVNNIWMTNFVSVKIGTTDNTGTYAIKLDRTGGGYVNRVYIHNGVLQQPLSGFIDIGAPNNFDFSSIQCYDSATKLGHPLVNMRASTGGSQPQVVTINNLYSKIGTATIADIKYVSSSTSLATISNSTIDYLDMGSYLRSFISVNNIITGYVTGSALPLNLYSALEQMKVGNIHSNGAISAGISQSSSEMLTNPTFTTIDNWEADTGVTLTLSSGSMTVTNTSAGFVNFYGYARTTFSETALYKVVVKLSAVRTFPATGLRIYTATSSFQTVANTTSEQIFYIPLRALNYILFRTNSTLDVDIDYVDVYEVGYPGGISISGEYDATARSTGIGTIKFLDATARDNVGFIDVIINGVRYYIPYFAGK